MADEARTWELLRFSDPGQSIAVEIGHGDPLPRGQERYCAAHIVLQSGFVNGRLGVLLSSQDLDDWERCLDALHAEERVERRAALFPLDLTPRLDPGQPGTGMWETAWPAPTRSAWGFGVPEPTSRGARVGGRSVRQVRVQLVVGDVGCPERIRVQRLH
ncbi:DUF5959 family protein [Nocardiopsis quinghaiensis]|uniref:DUF5959 family protein n=1 Tax=Nocardiopsis quinghaiensis TaxID=464995 RepID=UPI001CC23AFD